MGTITTGIGLISGIDTATLIEQLLAIEGRGKLRLQQRIGSLQAQRTAMLDINARLLNMKGAALSFRKDKIFQSALATSSNESVLTATANAGALPGIYTFIIDRLVGTSQQMTRGFADTGATLTGLTQMTFELGGGRLATQTELIDLNGGAGVRRGGIVITDRAGSSTTIDLARVGEIREVLDAINNNGTVSVTARISGDRLVIDDTSGGSGTLSVQNAAGSFTATDLGIAGTGGTTNTITGSVINTIGGTTALTKLNDSNGVLINGGIGNPDFVITDRLGTAHQIVLGQYDNGTETEPAVDTTQGVIDRISAITAGAVTAAISADGVSLTLTDTTGGTGSFSVTGAGGNGDQTALDLGILNSGVTSNTIAGGRILAGMDSVLIKNINGGGGFSGATTVTIQDRSGASFTITNADTYSSLADLVDALNDAAQTNNVDIVVGLNEAMNGLFITDSSGGSGNLIVTGDGATALKIATAPAGVAADTVRGSNLQHQYVTGSSRLEDLNFGRGVGTGTFRISDANGQTAVVDIASDSTTLQDIITEINSKGLDILARVNDNGDGLLLEDTSTAGTLAIRVDTISGSTARDLGILGVAADPVTANFIDGSYERIVAIAAGATLADMVVAVKDANVPVQASIINTGSGSSPIRVTFTSEIAGREGELSIDTGGFDLGLSVLATGQDARVFFGSDDPAQAILIKSTTNTLDGIISDVNIDLLSASTQPVTLTVSRDTEAIVAAVKRLVTTFNDAIGRIDDADSFDAETEKRGILLGNATVARVRSALYRAVQGRALGVGGQFQFLTQVGIRVGSGGTLELDETKFRAALEKDFGDVTELFTAFEKQTSTEELGEGVTTNNTIETFTALGLAEQIDRLLDRFTDSIDGTLTRADDNFEEQIGLIKDRIVIFDQRLEARRGQLQREFQAMEAALAQLQNQQAALASLAGAVLAASIGGIRSFGS